MISFLKTQRTSPIGIDLGSRSVKLVQFTADRTNLIDAARRELSAPIAETLTPEARAEQLAGAIRQAREGRRFRGRDAVICLGARELFVQNIRVPKVAGHELDKTVQQEAAMRLPFPINEAELRYLDAADVRQGDSVKRELVLLACQRSMLQHALDILERAGLRPVAVDVQPCALLRSYARQFRRDEDRTQRAMVLHIGATNSVVVITRGYDPLFVKYIDVGGRQMDEAVARSLEMDLEQAAGLRRHNGDRRVDQQDPEITQSIQDAIRPVLDRLVTELSLCLRYYSVTFRGQQLSRVVLGGGEATPALAEALGSHFNLKCELADPLRSESAVPPGPKAQWDVAAGLALREMN